MTASDAFTAGAEDAASVPPVADAVARGIARRAAKSPADSVREAAAREPAPDASGFGSATRERLRAVLSKTSTEDKGGTAA
jgi:hypothetical protein